MDLVFIGKTVSTHGIKGELKVISDFEYSDRAFQIGNSIMINNIMHKIKSVRYHKNYILLGIDNYDNINDVLEYVGYNIYIARDDLNLLDDEYLLTDLVGAKVVDENATIGEIIGIEDGVNNYFIRVKADKEFLIPLIDEYVVKFALDEKILYTKGAKDLIL